MYGYVWEILSKLPLFCLCWHERWDKSTERNTIQPVRLSVLSVLTCNGETKNTETNRTINQSDTQSNKHHASENVSIKRINCICSIDLFFLSCQCSVLVCFVVCCSTQYISVLSLFCSGLFCCVLFHTTHFWPCPTSQAADGATPPNVSMATVQVTVQDVNDNSPVFSQESYVGYLDDNSPAATSVSHCPDCLA